MKKAGMLVFVVTALFFTGLLFSQCQTAFAVNNTNPALACDPDSNRYLCVYENRESGEVVGRFIDDGGNPVGDEFSVSDENGAEPSVAYGVYGGEGRYMVVWQNNGNIYGKLLDAGTGQIAGSTGKLAIDEGGKNSYPSVVFDSVNGRFLVAWQYDWGDEIHGCLVDAGGTLCGPSFVISGTASSKYYPSAAFDGVNERFLVVWADYSTVAAVYGQLIEANGDLFGTSLHISGDPGYSHNLPTVTFNTTNEEYLVVWERSDGNWKYDIRGRVLEPDGTPAGGSFGVSGSSGEMYNTSLAYNALSDRYLAVWEVQVAIPDNADIYGQMVNGGGIPDGSNFTVCDDPGVQRKPVVAGNSQDGSFLVAYEYYWDSEGGGATDIAYSLVTAHGLPLPRIQFSQAEYAVNENVGSAVITVTRSGNKNSVSSVVYSTTGGTAGAGSDYTPVSGTLIFNQDEESKTFTVPILDDSNNEGDETVNLALSSPSGATLGFLKAAVLTIVDSGSSGDGNGDGGVTGDQPPTGLTLIDRMPGYIRIGQSVRIDEHREEIVLGYNQPLLGSNPKHVPRAYCWNAQKGKWVALASYPAGDGRVKAINDGKYKGWFNVFGVVQPAFTDIEPGHWAEQIINRMNGLGVIEGYPDDQNRDLVRSVRADRNISRVEFAVLIYRILNMDTDKPLLNAMPGHEAEALLQARYSDGNEVPGWAVEMVGAVADKGLMADRNGRLEADMPITRIEAAVMVSRALKVIPGYKYKAADLSVFADSAQVPEWANGEVAENVILGYPDGTLRPNGEITRAESLALLLRLFVYGLGW